MSTYDVDVTREDGFWVGVVRGVRGGATETRRLSALRGEVQDLLSGLLDVDEDDLQLEFHLENALGVAANKAVGSFDKAKSQLADAQWHYELAQRDAVHELSVAGVSLRDAGALLGISHQRVQQLLADA
jgi:hypothetical protein